jgi:serine/threonine protein kinase
VIIGSDEIDIPPSFKSYDIVRFLGSGGFSVAFLVRDRPTGEEYACKVVSRKLLSDTHLFSRFEQEIRLLEQLCHPNIVHVFEVVFEPDIIFVVMEYCPGGDLCKFIEKFGRLDEASARAIFRQLLDAMIYLHDRQIAHRDIKPDNILLDANMRPKIADLGLCHTLHGNSLLSTRCGTIYYAAPELIRGADYDGRAIDVWSLGVVLYVMVSGALPWSITTDAHVYDQILHARYRLPVHIGGDLADLLKSMISLVASARPTMREISETPWARVDIPQSFESMAALPSLFAPASSASSMRMRSLRPERMHREIVVEAGVRVPAGAGDARQMRLLLRKIPPKNELIKKRSAMTASLTSMGGGGFHFAPVGK